MLLASGHFSRAAFDHAALAAAARPLGLKAMRARMARAKAADKEAAKVKPEPVVPVGERSGLWWREEPLVRRRPRRGRGAGAGTGGEEGGGGAEAKLTVDRETADILWRVREAKKEGKAALKRSKALWSDFERTHSLLAD